MPKCAVTVDIPNIGPGVLVEVPPIGAVENGSTVEVYLSKENATYLATAPHDTIKVKTLKEPTIDEVKNLADKAETLDELAPLFIGEERAGAISYLTDRRVVIGNAQVEPAPEAITEADPQDALAPLADTGTTQAAVDSPSPTAAKKEGGAS